MRIVYHIAHCDPQTYRLFLSDCQMWFASHMSHICRLSFLKGGVNDLNVYPRRMRSDIRGVSPTSGGVCHPSHLPVLLLFAGLLQSVKNWCQHLSKAKCLFYTECQSSHNLLINQQAKKQCVFVFKRVCGRSYICTHLGVLFNHLWKGSLIRVDAIIKVSCAQFVKRKGPVEYLIAKAAAGSVADTKCLLIARLKTGSKLHFLY